MAFPDNALQLPAGLSQDRTPETVSGQQLRQHAPLPRAQPDPPLLPSGREGVHRRNLRPGLDGFVHDIKGRTLEVCLLYRSRIWLPGAAVRGGLTGLDRNHDRISSQRPTAMTPFTARAGSSGGSSLCRWQDGRAQIVRARPRANSAA